VTDLSPLSDLGELKNLNLRECEGMTDLSSLASLKGLQFLDLSFVAVTDLSPLAGLHELQDLWLPGTGVIDLSPLIEHMSIQNLNLSCTEVEDLSILSRFQCLQILDLAGCQYVTDLSPLAGLQDLQSLDLSHTGAMDLSPLAGLHGLQRLDLSRTGIEDLSPLYGFHRLQSLRLEFCQKLTNLLPLAGLLGLQSLDLRFCHSVTDLSPLAGLLELQSLRLESCRGVTDLSPLGKLRRPQNLDFSGTSVTDLSPLVELQALQDLSFGATRVEDLAPLAHLQRLQTLNLEFCPCVTDLSPLAGLVGLRRLVLAFCSGITNLYPLAELKELELLNLQRCRSAIPAILLRLFADQLRLRELIVDEATDVPREVLSHAYFDNCLPRLRTFFSELDLGSEAENEVKVILLGNGRVGKTQLCRRFRGELFDDSVPSTHGIQIWREKLQIKIGTEEQFFQVNWWDFGGQDIYHGTHALFLRSRAVFLILWTPNLENREEYSENGIPMRNQPLAYWLNYVRSLAGEGSPVVVVQSQCDRFADQNRDLPKLDGFGWAQHSSYSAKTDLGREVLEAQIREAIRYLLERNGALRIGKGRAELRRQLYEWRALDQALPPEDRQHRTLSLDDFQALCDQTGSIVSWEHALDYFHHTGVVFYQPRLFDSRIVLDQTWALDAVYAVFHRGQAMPWLRNTGRFTREDLATTVWQSYPPEEQRLFLGLMESCGVCFSYRKTDQEEARYVAPDLLPGFEAVSDRVHLVWDEKRDTKTLGLKYCFFHPAVVRSLMSEVGRRAGDLAEYWKYGLWFKDGRWNAQLLVQFKNTSTEEAPGAGVLELRAQGHDPLGLLREIRKDILQRHIGEQPEELLTLDGITVARSALSTVIDGQVLDTQSKSVPAAAFGAFFEDRENQRDEDRPTEKVSGIDIRPQPVGPDEKPREVYISYAWGDDSDEGKRRAQAVDGLYAALAKDGFRPVRDKEAMRAGDLISAFIRQLTRADRVVAVISEKYLRSPYCMKEIYEIWLRCQRDAEIMAKTVIPIVLPGVKIESLWDRKAYVDYWGAEAQRVDELERQGKMLSLSPQSFQEARLIREFAYHVDGILYFLQDVLMPRKLEVHLDNGFEAVREALRRRVGEGS
jgi:internalin A